MGKRAKDFCLIVIGTSIIAGGIKMFFEPNQLVAGGVSGLGIVLDYFSGRYLNFSIPLWLTNIVCNLPLLLGAGKLFGKGYLKRTLFTSVLFSLALYYMGFLPVYRGNMILVSVFGGVMVGIGSGLTLSAQAATGGTDLAAALLHKLHPHFSVSHGLFLMDALVILLGMFAFGMEQAMFAVLSIYVSSQCVGAILEGVQFAKAAYIISDKADEIAAELMENAQRGVTALHGTGMYTKKEKKILLCVFSPKEISIVKSIIMNIDRNAFFLLTDMKEVLGEGFEKL